MKVTLEELVNLPRRFIRAAGVKTVWELQAARKTSALQPVDWDTYRKALIDSGMVDEARERR